MNFRCDTATYWAWVGTSVLNNDSREDDDDGFDDDDHDADTLMSFSLNFSPSFLKPNLLSCRDQFKRLVMTESWLHGKNAEAKFSSVFHCKAQEKKPQHVTSHMAAVIELESEKSLPWSMT